MLDPQKGGHFVISPSDTYSTSKQEYYENTNVLRTEFMTAQGTLEVVDWMHMNNFSFVEEEQHRLPALYRLIRCTAGTVECRIQYCPKFDYARARTILTPVSYGLLAHGALEEAHLFTHCAFSIVDEVAEATVTLQSGQDLSFICAYGKVARDELPPPSRSLEQTIHFWQRWSSECEAGNCLALPLWKKQVTRSALVLKVLAGGKGIAAAATTSLPEVLGGSDNWDYRFNWIRDTSFTIQALASLGHLSDAKEFLDWITNSLFTANQKPSDLKVLYPLYDFPHQKEEELTHLSGYENSRPVRIGNGAAEQKQYDIYGEILEAVFRSEHLHPKMDEALTQVLSNLLDYVCEIWREPDSGIWELRSEPQHYVYSKVMCWVALDRGIRLAETHGWRRDLGRWKTERSSIHAQILERGYSSQKQCFMQAYDSEVYDATALLFPILELIAPDHPYAINTLNTLQRELADGALVYRSSTHYRKEGAFGLCSFWLVDALAFAGRVGEAHMHFEKLLSMGNHLGLYAEEIDPTSGAFLGNFPQAFTHVGLINSAVYLSRFIGLKDSKQTLIGDKHIV